MFPNRTWSLTLLSLVCFSTALASAYDIDQLESQLPLSSPYSPLFFSASLSNFASHVRLGNDPVTARSPEPALDVASLRSPREGFQAETMLTLPGANCRASGSHNWRGAQENGRSVAEKFDIRSSDAWNRLVTYDFGSSPASGELTPAVLPRQDTALVVDEFPCLPTPSLHGLSTPFRPSLGLMRVRSNAFGQGERPGSEDINAGATAPNSAKGSVEVKLTEYKIEMPASIGAGATTFDVTNTGNKTHGFEIEGNGIEKALEPRLKGGEKGSLQVDLRPGTYKVYCPVFGHKWHGMSIDLTVK